MRELAILSRSGFVFSLEALLSVIFFTLFILSLPSSKTSTMLEELHLLQKANDVLKVWSIERNFSSAEMLSDIAFAFPSNCVTLEVSSKLLHSCPESSNTISTTALLFDNSGNLFEIKLKVNR